MTKIRQSVASALGIELRPGTKRREDGSVTRGESTVSVGDSSAYNDPEPSVIDFFRDITPTKKDVRQYLWSLFPCTKWISQYTLRWLLGDVIAGITVGSVVIPQGMAYASLAALPPEYGLYSSFMGVLVYWLFATSKDITIGPVAVMSTITGNVVLNVQATNPEIPGHIVASAMAIIAGCIIFFIGVIRFGWIVEFISLSAIAAFMTGSAVNITVGQIPTLMGIGGFSTRDSTYQVAINILKHLGRTQRYDAAMGISALALLYILRFAFHYLASKYPTKRKLFNTIGTTRVVFVILLFTMISWLANRNNRDSPQFKILGAVPRGFQHVGVPTINMTIMKAFASQIPATVIVLWIEHIAIAKAFGRVNHYRINNSQEMVAIGLTNILGPFLGAYPTTGSFSRTAINAKAGVCSPAGGLVSAVLVLLAIYALPAVFFYIPSASLSAIIIHAVCDLITTPDTLYQFWKVSPFEVVIFFAGVLVTVFSTIEIGIYVTICVSLALLLYRFANAKGTFLGKIKVNAVLSGRVLAENGEITNQGSGKAPAGNNSELTARNIFLPIDHTESSHRDIQIEVPYPGIFIYRFSDGFNYPNANRYLDELLAKICLYTRPGKLASLANAKNHDWSDLQMPQRPTDSEATAELPPLEAIILDFSSVNNIDITAIQQLIDVRNQLDRWAAPETPEWHIAAINNKWTRRALVHAGFGYPTPDSPHYHRWKPLFSVADIGGGDSAATQAQLKLIEQDQQRTRQLHSAMRSPKESSLRSSFTSAKPGSVAHGSTHIRLSSIDEDRPQVAPEEDRNISIKTKTTIVHQTARPASASIKQAKHQHSDQDWGFPMSPITIGLASQRLGGDLESQIKSSTAYTANAAGRPPKITLVTGLDKPLFHVVEGVSRPLFHVGLSSALQSAIHNLELKKELRKMTTSDPSDS